MRLTLLALMMLSVGVSAALAAENPLSIRILKVERVSSQNTYLLFEVTNSSEKRFSRTTWSCVFMNKNDPVHEESSAIENVPPRDRAIQRIIQGYGGPFDKVDCRYMSSRPSMWPD